MEPKRNFITAIFSWVWNTVWGILGPVLKITIRLSIIGALVWLIFYAPFAAEIRTKVMLAAGPVFESLPSFASKKINAYDSLKCEKVRMRVAEAEKIRERYTKKLKEKEAVFAVAALGKLLSGDAKGAGRISAKGNNLTAKERYELEEADAFLKGKIIDDLECFKK